MAKLYFQNQTGKLGIENQILANAANRSVGYDRFSVREDGVFWDCISEDVVDLYSNKSIELFSVKMYRTDQAITDLVESFINRRIINNRGDIISVKTDIRWLDLPSWAQIPKKRGHVNAEDLVEMIRDKMMGIFPRFYLYHSLLFKIQEENIKTVLIKGTGEPGEVEFFSSNGFTTYRISTKRGLKEGAGEFDKVITDIEHLKK